MNYTTKYHLPQWEEDDRIMRTDFNEAMTTIENSLKDIKSSFYGGYYTGRGTAVRIIVGFRPSVLLIYEVNNSSKTESEAAMTGAMFTADPDGRCIRFDVDGFVLAAESDYYPKINVPNQRYGYIAFR